MSDAPLLVGVGHVALDNHFSVAALPQGGGKTPSQRHRQLVGGMTANSMVAAARLGARTRFVSPVGDDASAATFRAHFAAEGVDATRLVPVAGAQSSVSAIVVAADGERMIVNHRGSALLQVGALGLGCLDGAHLLLTDPRCPHWAEAALRAARTRGLPSLLDADTAQREDLRRLVGLADWAVFSQPGRAAFHDGSDEDALAMALAAGAAVAVVTRGPAGAVWQRAGEPPRKLPAFAVQPVLDTTAAGDVFHGALGVALAEGQATEAALRFAAAAAALKCLHADGVLGAPRRAEVEHFLNNV